MVSRTVLLLALAPVGYRSRSSHGTRALDGLARALGGDHRALTPGKGVRYVRESLPVRK